LVIKGPGSKTLTIDAGNHSRVFDIDYAVSVPMPTAISGLTLTRGASVEDGGALLSFETTILDHVAITKSHARGSGGGAAILTDGRAAIANCSFIANVAGGDGGGLDVQASEALLVSKTGFASNVAKHRGGGIAVHLADDALAGAVVASCKISGNTAVDAGGGLELVAKSATKIIALRSCMVSANQVTGATGRGGGVHIESGTVALAATTIMANVAAKEGGGIDDEAARLTIVGGRIVGNATTEKTGAGGGGLAASGARHVIIAGTFVSGNSTAAHGGGLLFGKGVVASLKSVAVAGNDAGIDGPQIFAPKATLTFAGLTLR
jgi:predicted outer membrane repeat protein